MTLDLDPKEIEFIVNVLAQRPFAEVAQLIDKIVSQAKAQPQPPLQAVN